MTMNSKEYCSLVSVLFAVFIPAIVARSSSSSSSIDQTPDLIEETCQKTPYPDFCITRLRPDPRSPTAEGPADLGLIMLDMVYTNAQTTLTTIRPLIIQTEDPRVKGALVNCNRGYISTVSAWVPSSRDSFNGSDPEVAVKNMVYAAEASVRCEDGFKGLGPSPLTHLNDFAKISALVCSAIAKNL